MKATCDQQDLLKALRIAKKVTDPKHAVLGHILLRAQDGWLFVRGLDLSTSVEIFVEAHVKEPGSIVLLKASTFVDVVRSLTKESVTITGAWPESIQIAGIALPRGDPEEYPELFSTMAEPQYVKVNSEELQKGLSRVSFAASRDVSRQQLMNVAITEGRLVASDGKRLAEYQIPELGALQGILPIKAAAAVEGLLKLQHDMSAETLIAIKDKIATIQTAVGLVRARLIEGQLPDYLSLIPTTFDTEVTVVAKVLRRLVKQAAAPLAKDNKIVALCVREGDLYVESEAVLQGLPVCAHSDVVGLQDLAPAFTEAFLDAGLKVAGKETVRIGLNRKGPTVISEGSWRYVFMPVLY
jgi:DNA polymerase-3 subunit beta